MFIFSTLRSTCISCTFITYALWTTQHGGIGGKNVAVDEVGSADEIMCVQGRCGLGELRY